MRFSLKELSYVFTITLVLKTFDFATAGPLHAQCKVEWFFGVPCRDVYTSLVTQIKTWKTAAGCAHGGEKCLYQLESANVHFIKAKHTTPVKRYVDDLSFRLVPYQLNAHCHVSALSVSEAWYTVIDYGTNYCNLFNLVEGSGLTSVSDYKEVTNDFICTQHSTANCTIY